MKILITEAAFALEPVAQAGWFQPASTRLTEEVAGGRELPTEGDGRDRLWY